jgi:hypothetical protein
MEKSVTEINQRLDSLEERLKYVFGELEKKLQQNQPEEIYTVEERMQELEDLLLLLQLENTKIKEKVGETSIDFGIVASGPDFGSRLSRIEEVLGRGTPMDIPTAEAPHVSPEFGTKIAALEEKIKKIHSDSSQLPKAVEDYVKTRVEEETRLLEKRVRTLEALLEKRGRDEIEEAESDLLDDIQKILKH